MSIAERTTSSAVPNPVRATRSGEHGGPLRWFRVSLGIIFKSSRVETPPANGVTPRAPQKPVAALIALTVFLAPLFAPLLQAHPVAQGAMEVFVSDDNLELRARVSLEQVFVANTFAQTPAASLDEAFGRHGDYLAGRVRVFAEDRQLAGRRVGFEPPRPGPNASYAIYIFEYPLGTSASSFRIEQDVLNEFDYAPGNRWEATYVTRVRHGDRLLLEGALLTPRAPLRFTSGSRPGTVHMARDFLQHGIAHILTGYDHLLFISALALAVATFWELIKVIAAFTLAHTLTLVLSVLDLVRLPSHIVEPMIAASIVIVALQNLCWPARSRGPARLAVAFFFGLFHGLGFAGGLVAVMEGMPGLALGIAILAFSLGVEIGHQIVVLPVFGVTELFRRWWRGKPETRGVPPDFLIRAGSAVICAAGLFYFVAALTS